MALSVIYDTSVILAQMTPVPQDGSIIWRWMVDGLVEPVVSDRVEDCRCCQYSSIIRCSSAWSLVCVRPSMSRMRAFLGCRLSATM